MNTREKLLLGYLRSLIIHCERHQIAPTNQHLVSLRHHSTQLLVDRGVEYPKTISEPLPKWMRWDPILWVIVALFVIFELVAHFEYHNESGMQTLSHVVVDFVRKYGWPARGLVIAAGVALIVHLNGVC